MRHSNTNPLQEVVNSLQNILPGFSQQENSLKSEMNLWTEVLQGQKNYLQKSHLFVYFPQVKDINFLYQHHPSTLKHLSLRTLLAPLLLIENGQAFLSVQSSILQHPSVLCNCGKKINQASFRELFLVKRVLQKKIFGNL